MANDETSRASTGELDGDVMVELELEAKMTSDPRMIGSCWPTRGGTRPIFLDCARQGTAEVLVEL